MTTPPAFAARGLAQGARTALGLGALVGFLALAASLPALSLWVLGYLLAVEGRIARGETLRQAFPLLEAAPRAAAVAAIGWLWILPVRLLWAAAQDAQVIAPDATAAKVLGTLTLAGGLGVAAHLGLALLRDAPVAEWVWPVGNLRWALRRSPALVVRTRLVEGWRALEPLRLWELGLKGFAGALLWLGAPALLWIAARATERPRPGLALLGGLLLIPVLAWLPFLQVHFAVEGRWRALIEWRIVRLRFLRAPLAFVFALLVTYLLTLPLFLLKIVLPPRDAAGWVTIFFVGTVLPVRLLLAWAWRRALRRERPVSPWISVPARWVLLALLAVYASVLFLAPLVDSHGQWALLTHHVFLVPSPF